MSFAMFLFDLANPADAAEFRQKVAAREYAVVLWDFDQYLNERLANENLDGPTRRALEDARERLARLVVDNGITLAA